jgi:uncharacterized LabA/DUF88 family protein
MKCIIIVDGAYLQKIAVEVYGLKNPNLPHSLFNIFDLYKQNSDSNNLNLLKIRFHDSLPFMSKPGTDDQIKRFNKKQDVFQKRLLNYSDIEIEYGRCVRIHDTQNGYVQKGVDVNIAIDILVYSHHVDHMIIVSGDSDLEPALKHIKGTGVKTALVCSETIKEYHDSTLTLNNSVNCVCKLRKEHFINSNKNARLRVR